MFSHLLWVQLPHLTSTLLGSFFLSSSSTTVVYYAPTLCWRCAYLPTGPSQAILHDVGWLLFRDENTSSKKLGDWSKDIDKCPSQTGTRTTLCPQSLPLTTASQAGLREGWVELEKAREIEWSWVPFLGAERPTNSLPLTKCPALHLAKVAVGLYFHHDHHATK